MALQDNQLNQKIQALPPEMQQEVLDFVEFLEMKFKKNHPDQIFSKKSDSRNLSAFDLAEKLGIIGIVEGPPDLSTNKAYFDDFGQ